MKHIRTVRILLGILIVLNLIMIFSFSGESAVESGKTSKTVTELLARIVVRGFEEMPLTEQESIIESMHPTVRKLAHMTEFGLLCGLSVLLLQTWKQPYWKSTLLALFFTGAVASIDEFNQYAQGAGRAGQFSDVLIDLLGGLLVSLLLFCVFKLKSLIQKRMQKNSMKTTNYRVACPKLNKSIKIALVSDLHDNPSGPTLEHLKAAKPDLILIPGDLTDDIEIKKGAPQTLDFLQKCAEIAPTYYSLGNHEIRCYHKGNPWRKPIPEPIPDRFRQDVANAGATLLDNESVRVGDYLICGLTSGINGGKNEPNTSVLEAFCKEKEGIKLLLCHHPEYYPIYLADKEIDLIVCGHAHGGQWRIFNRGVYAPGQGLFPKYTSGVIGGNCVISRGLGDHTKIPRIFNPRELVIIEFGGV